MYHGKYCMGYLKFYCLCFPVGFLWCRVLYFSLLSILSNFCVWCKSEVYFHFFTCTCPDLPTSFIKEYIFTPFYVLALFVKYKLTILTWVYFWALYSVPLVCVSVLMPVTDCFDYSGLEITYFKMKISSIKKICL